MKKSFLVFALAGLLSLPSVVLAEASWYGSIRAGWQSDDISGVANAGSRWGIKGTSEISEGLSAVYRFEHNIDSTSASLTSGRLSYVGLSGGFGTLSIGQVDNAALNNAGFVDNSTFLGTSELANKVGNTVSYAASVGSMSFQIDAIGDRGSANDKDLDSAQFGASLQIGENGTIGFGYIKHPTKDMDEPTRGSGVIYSDCEDVANGNRACVETAVNQDLTAHIDSDKQTQIAGKYTIGGATMHLGYGQRKVSTGSSAAMRNEDDSAYGMGLEAGDKLEAVHKTTFFGIAGGLGDTGVSYFLQVRNKKDSVTKVKASYLDRHKMLPQAGGDVTEQDVADRAKELGLEVDGTTVRAPADKGDDGRAADVARGKMKTTSKTTPFVLGLSRSLGGGASVHFEYVNDDDDATKNTSLLALKVDF